MNTTVKPSLTTPADMTELLDSHGSWVDTIEARERIRQCFARISDATLINVLHRVTEQVEDGDVTKLAIVKLIFGINEMERRIR